MTCNQNCEQGRRCGCDTTNARDCEHGQLARACEICRLEGEIAELTALVREWACDDCNTVYPGPPQKGFKCVICPKCGGSTMPLPDLKLRRAERELAAERAKVARLREALQGMIEQFGYGVVHPQGMVHDEHEAIRAALAEPTEAMRTAGCVAICEIYRREGGWCGLKAAQDQMMETWNAVAAKRLEELG